MTLIFFYLIDKISDRNEISFKTLIIYSISFLTFLFIFWPNSWENTSAAFFSAFNLNMSWKGNINFLGEYYFSKNLPYYYLIFWIVISTPIIHLLLFGIGFYNYSKRLISRYFKIKKISFYSDLWRSKGEKKDFLIFVNLIFFILVLSFLNISLYNSWRLGYFLYIFILYFASMGIYLFLLKFKKKLIYLTMILLVLNSFLIYRVILYHPTNHFISTFLYLLT